MSHNQNATYHASERYMTVCYVDTNKHYNIPYEESNLKDLQLFGNSIDGSKFQNEAPPVIFEQDEFSPEQNKIYREVVHGLTPFTPEEIGRMSFKTKMRIINRHKEAQRILNLWKQQITNKSIDNLLGKMFPNILKEERKKSCPIRLLVDATKDYTNPRVINNISFRDLRIDKKQIAERLIQHGLLPRNFFKIKK